MTLHDLYAKWACYEDIQTCVTTTEYSDTQTLIQDVSSMLTANPSHEYNLTQDQIENNIQTILPEFVPAYYYFNNDVSLLYAFSKKNINKMLVYNPSLALYVDQNDILVKKSDPYSDGIFLSFILPEHEAIFNQYSPTIYEKATIISIPENPTEWKYPEFSERCMINTNSLAELYVDPSIGMLIYATSTLYEWRRISFLYMDASIFDQNLKEDLINIGAEFENKSV